MCLSRTYTPCMHFQQSEVYITAKKSTIIALAVSCPFRKNISQEKHQDIMQNTNNHRYGSSHQMMAAATRPANHFHILLIHIHKRLHMAIVLATLHQWPQLKLIAVQTTSLFQFNLFQFSKKSVSNAVISVLAATFKNSEEPGTFEMVLNTPLSANCLPTFKIFNVTPPSSFPSTSSDNSSINTQSTSTPSPPEKPSTASSEDHWDQLQ